MTQENSPAVKVVDPWPLTGTDFIFDNFVYDLTANLEGLDLVTLVAPKNMAMRSLHLGVGQNMSQATTLVKLALDLALLKRPLQVKGDFFTDLSEVPERVVLVSVIDLDSFMVCIGEKEKVPGLFVDLCLSYYKEKKVDKPQSTWVEVEELDSGSASPSSKKKENSATKAQKTPETQPEKVKPTGGVIGIPAKQSDDINRLSKEVKDQKAQVVAKEKSRGLASPKAKAKSIIINTSVNPGKGKSADQALNPSNPSESSSKPAKHGVIDNDVKPKIDADEQLQQDRDAFFTNPLVGSLISQDDD